LSLGWEWSFVAPVKLAADLGFAPTDIDAMVRDGVLYAEQAAA
jgi:hypothetical protein